MRTSLLGSLVEANAPRITTRFIPDISIYFIAAAFPIAAMLYNGGMPREISASVVNSLHGVCATSPFIHGKALSY